MVRERDDLLTPLDIQVALFEQGQVDKHRAAETAGREILPRALGSAASLRILFDGFDELSGHHLTVLGKMALSQVIRRTLPDVPPQESLAVLAEIADGARL